MIKYDLTTHNFNDGSRRIGPFIPESGRSTENLGFGHFLPNLAVSGPIGAESGIWPFLTKSGRFWADRRRIRDLAIFD